MKLMLLESMMVGSNDLEKSKQFYDALLGAINIGPGIANGKRYFYRSPTGTFAIRAAHQGFITNNLPALPIDNGLKCHSDVKTKRLTTQTIHTTLLFDPIRKLHAEPLLADFGSVANVW